MRLSRLTLSGFKSFADTTVLTFDDPMTGVVGPNGCGKSNIVDAIKWVLGERSSKSLRGKEMIDVIFAGSAGRKPAGMASVTLTFDNPVINEDGSMDEIDVGGAVAKAATEEGTTADEASENQQSEIASSTRRDRSTLRRGLPIDADEVAVQRRLYRDGTSQYLINAKRARLRDIRELFLDTGIGADAYSIIEQGKVDAMLLASPMERRTIFEEAAGIARFKQRRIESLRKLDKAERNLLLTREQLLNTERRLRMVRGQATKARKYQELHTEYVALRAAVLLAEYHELMGRLERACIEAAEAASAAATARDAFEAVEAARQDAELARHEAQRSLQDTQRDSQHERARADAANQRRTMLVAALQEASVRAADLESIAQQATARKASISADLGRATASTTTFERALTEAHTQLESIQAERAGAMEQLAASRTGADRLRIVVNDIERKLAASKATRQADQRRSEQMAGQIQRLADRASALGTEAAQLDTDHEKQTSVVSEIARLLGESLLANTSHADKLAAISSDRRELAERASGLEHERLRLDTRITTLNEMVRDRVGLGSAVREMFDKQQSGQGFSSILCPLAEAIEASTETAHIVETALGETIRAVLVPTVPELPDEPELAALSERVTFVSLAPIATINRAQSNMSGVLSSIAPHPIPVRSLVGARADIARTNDRLTEDGINAMLDVLLEQTYLVESLDAALMLQASYPPSARFVTRAGTLLDRDGRVLAGRANATEGDSAGLLHRRAELAELQTELGALQSELADAQSQLERVDSEAAILNTERSRLQALLEDRRRTEISSISRLETLESDRNRVSAQLAELQDELADTEHRRDTFVQEQQAAVDATTKLAALLDEQHGALTEAQQHAEAAHTKSESTGEQLAAARVDVGTLSEQLAASKRETRALESSVDQVTREINAGLARMDQTRATIAQSQLQIEQTQADAADAQAKVTQLDVRATELAGSLDDHTQRVTDANTRLTAQRQSQERADTIWRDRELSRREFTIKVESIEDRASASASTNDDEFDLLREYTDYLELIADDDSHESHESHDRHDRQVSQALDDHDEQSTVLVPADPSIDSAHVDTLRKQIRSLGAVNLSAITEETQLETKNEDLVTQITDLDDARTKLITLIDQLNDASRQRFGESLEKVREHFAAKDGMFRKLFGGGRAEIRLMPLVREVDGHKVVTDEIDLLESGIEIIAKPPGKEPRALSQLSGGEKTLTAVALLLAIFQSKPSCFCVLDEVDAALDEANVARFVRVVREFTSYSHFIVITHNKKTMRAADRLFGVTMQERGVSTLVPVKFDQFDPDSPSTSSAGLITRTGKATNGELSSREQSQPEAMPLVQTVTSKPATKPPAISATSQRNKPSMRSALAKMREHAVEEPNDALKE